MLLSSSRWVLLRGETYSFWKLYSRRVVYYTVTLPSCYCKYFIMLMSCWPFLNCTVQTIYRYWEYYCWKSRSYVHSSLQYSKLSAKWLLLCFRRNSIPVFESLQSIPTHKYTRMVRCTGFVVTGLNMTFCFYDGMQWDLLTPSTCSCRLTLTIKSIPAMQVLLIFQVSTTINTSLLSSREFHEHHRVWPDEQICVMRTTTKTAWARKW